MKSRRRFLVTGAAGFVGANLCRRLVERGEEVHVLIKPSSATWRIDDLREDLAVHEADITHAEAVERVVDRSKPTVIYHLATHGAYHYQEDAEQILLINVIGLWNLLRACNRVGYELFVNTGSSSEYGRKQFAMRETDLLDPNSFYAVAKATQSLLCQHMGRRADRQIVTLRLFSVYGSYEEPNRLIPNLMMSAIDNTCLRMVSPRTARDFVFVDDVVDVYLEVDRLRELAGEILNVGTGVQTSLSELLEIMGEVQGRPVNAEWESVPARTWDAMTWVADVSKIRSKLGVVPRTAVRLGLAKSLRWFREHENLYRPKRTDGR